VSRRLRVLAVLGLAAVGACAGILGLQPKRTAVFAHRKHVTAGVSCLTCHTPTSLAGDTDTPARPTTAGCVTCHTQPHDTRDCTGCHSDPFAYGLAIEAREHLRFAHATHVAIASGNCARCHQDIAHTDSPIRPRMATCLGCHAHEDQFTADRCDVCHVDLEAGVLRPESHLVHEGDWLREHGVHAAGEAAICSTCHTERSCAACHGITAPAVPARVQFDRPDGSALHRAGFRSRHAEEARADPGSCSACHDDRACRDCHVREGVAAVQPGAGGLSPHPPGWVGVGFAGNDHGPAARRDPAACAACHGGAGEQLCVGCHRVGGVGGSPHAPGWSSNQPLSARPCRLCHQ
jgi:hypothetical protein